MYACVYDVPEFSILSVIVYEDDYLFNRVVEYALSSVLAWVF